MIQTIPETTQKDRFIDFGWILCRQPLEDSLFALSAEHPQVIPAWTAFNIKIIEGRGLRESCVGYSPVIEASPHRATDGLINITEVSADGRSTRAERRDHSV